MALAGCVCVCVRAMTVKLPVLSGSITMNLTVEDEQPQQQPSEQVQRHVPQSGR